MIPNDKRRLTELWEDRHTHDDDNFQEQITVLKTTVEENSDKPGVGFHEHGVTSVLLTSQAATRSVYSPNGPCAVYSPEADRTYLAFLGLDRDLYVTYYDHHEQTVALPVLADTRTIPVSNDHAAPSICLDLDGHIQVSWGSHNSVNRHVRSDSPHDISAWTAQSLAVGTYTFIRCDPDTGNLYIFYRAGSGSGDGHGSSFPAHEFAAFQKSTDGGVNWGSATAIIDTTGTSESKSDAYLEAVMPDSQGRFHFFWTVARGTVHDDTRINPYHAIFDPSTETWETADGTDLGAVIDWSEHADCLIVSDSEVAGGNVLVDGDTIWAWWVSVTDSTTKVAVWDGSTWAVEETGEDSFGIPYLVKDGLRYIDHPDVSGGSGDDVVLYGAPRSGGYFHQIATLLVAPGSDSFGHKSMVLDGQTAVALWQSRDPANEPNNATASDLHPIYLVLDERAGEYAGEIPETTADLDGLDDLTDVTISSPSSSDRLRYDGSAWVNTTLIWRPAMTYDGTNWLPVADGDGNAVMTEA